jgi:hypothetical protein
LGGPDRYERAAQARHDHRHRSAGVLAVTDSRKAASYTLSW